MFPIFPDVLIPDGAGIASFLPDAPVALLPVIEARLETTEAAWLKGMASAVHGRLVRLVPVRILPEVFLAQFSPATIPVEASTLLVVEPWGMPAVGQPQERLDGATLLRLLDRPFSATQGDPFPRPRPALSEMFALNTLGGWNGGSQAGCDAWVSAWPGWDEQALLSERVLWLRGLSHEYAERPLLPQSLQALLSSSSEGQRRFDLQIYATYLARMLAALIRRVQAHLEGQHA